MLPAAGQCGVVVRARVGVTRENGKRISSIYREAMEAALERLITASVDRLSLADHLSVSGGQAGRIGGQ